MILIRLCVATMNQIHRCVHDSSCPLPFADPTVFANKPTREKKKRLHQSSPLEHPLTCRLSCIGAHLDFFFAVKKVMQLTFLGNHLCDRHPSRPSSWPGSR